MIWRLRPQEYDLFDWLDPFGFLERVALPDHFALAATVKDESGEGDSPAGLLVAAVAAEHIIIEWICVAPEYRGQGIGDELILKIIEMSKKDCQREVAALFLETPELLPYLQETEDYFIWQGFLTKREAFGEWDIDLDTYLSHPLFRPSRTRPPRAKPLCEMGEGTLKTIIAALSEKKEASRLYDIGRFRAEYDKSLSCVLESGNNNYGIYLIQRIKDTCYPVFIYAESSRIAMELLICASERMRQTMPKEGRIHVIACDGRIEKMMDGFFSGQKIHGRYLIKN